MSTPLHKKRQAKEALWMSTVLLVAGGVLLCRAPSIGRPAVAGYVLLVALLWWVTSGDRPWVWSYAERTEATNALRLGFCALQINRTLGRILYGTIALLALVLICVAI